MVNIVKILLHSQSENQPLTGLQCDDVISGYTAANQWSPLTSLRCDVRACWDVRPSVVGDCDMLEGPMRNECQGCWILIGRFQLQVHDRSAVHDRQCKHNESELLSQEIC